MSMIIDGISASQHLDSSGEILKISGHDIEDLIEGKGVLNWEHNNDSSEDIIGAIIYAKKIMKRSDCEDDRQREYWDACGTSFVYIKAELFEDEKHPGAIAAAAIIRYYHKRKQKILAGFSIEGSTLERNDNVLERSVGRRVALTLRPCNKSAISGVLQDKIGEEVKKYMSNNSIDVKTVDVDALLLDDILKSQKSESSYLTELKKAISDLKKTLTAGGYDAAPSTLTGGSALQVESINRRSVGLPKEIKDKLKRAVTQWDKKRPLKEVVKAVMPEVSEDYIDHFTNLAEEFSLKKGIKPATRIDPYHSWNMNMDEKQRKLISGIYLDSGQEFSGSDHNEPQHKMVKLKNDAGSEVLVKYPDSDSLDSRDPAVSASNYYNLADSFFGLGDHVPTTNHFSNSKIGGNYKNFQAQEFISGAHCPWDEGSWRGTIQKAKEDGHIHKLAVMDMILDGDHDRHYGNILGKDGKVLHIDNDDSLSYSGHTAPYPMHFNNYEDVDGNIEEGIGNDLMHIDAIRWLSQLDPRAMVKKFLSMGMDKHKAKEGARRLALLQQQSSGNTLYKLHDLIYPKKSEVK